ncbi:unnamed protein product, partial [marine sediment metagenome]
AATCFAAFHLDGNDLDLDTHSDDGTDDVDPEDTAVNLVEGTYDFYQVDARDKADVHFYQNGVLVDGTGPYILTAETGTMRAVVHMEKTNNDTVGKVLLRDMWIRTAARA